MRGMGQGRDIGIGQDDAGTCFDMRGEDHLGAHPADRIHDLVNGGRRIGGPRAGALLPGHHHFGLGRKAAHVENLAPAEGKPAVADDQHALARAELPRHRLHPESAAARHHRHGIGGIDLFQHGRDIAHHRLELCRHVVQRPVGEDHGKFLQPVRVDVRQQGGHGQVLRSRFRLLFSAPAPCHATGFFSVEIPRGSGGWPPVRPQPRGPGRRSSLSRTFASTCPTPGSVMIRRRSTRSKSAMSRATTRRR